MCRTSLSPRARGNAEHEGALVVTSLSLTAAIDHFSRGARRDEIEALKIHDTQTGQSKNGQILCVDERSKRVSGGCCFIPA